MGIFAWDYVNWSYPGRRQQPELANRGMFKAAWHLAYQHLLAHEANGTQRQGHLAGSTIRVGWGTGVVVFPIAFCARAGAEGGAEEVAAAERGGGERIVSGL